MSTDLLTKTKTKWTAQSYFAWSRPDDKARYEVINGELKKMASPTLFHQAIVGYLHAIIFIFLRTNRTGKIFVSPVDVELGTTVVVPDLVFIRNEQMHIATGKRIVGAPTLIVEVLSLSTAKRDLTTKHELYAKHGVEEYWLINPDAQTIEILFLEEGNYVVLGEFERQDIVQSRVLSGFEMVAADLFTQP